MKKQLVLSFVLIAIVLALSARASVWIGPELTATTSTISSWQVTWLDSAFSAPVSGEILTWKVYGARAGLMKLQMFRPKEKQAICLSERASLKSRKYAFILSHCPDLSAFRWSREISLGSNLPLVKVDLSASTILVDWPLAPGPKRTPLI